MKHLFILLLLLPCLVFAQTGQELAGILSASGKDTTVVGATSQTTLNNNILLSSAGSGAVDIITGNIISYKSALIHLVPATGTVTAGVITFEGSNDNFVSTASPVYMYDYSSLTALPVTSYTLVATTVKFFVGNIPFKYFRARISTGVTGTTAGVQAFTTYKTTVYQHPTTFIAQPTAGSLNVTPASTPLMTGAIASAAAGDGAANPTGAGFMEFPRWFNGTTWDRPYNNINAVTGDAGAKTTTFNGATQTNFNAKGASIVLNFGTVTGTTPTLTAQLQYSADGGTTFLNLGTVVSAIIIATGTYGITVYPGTTAVAASVTAGTTAVFNISLPRTWRIVYTIGGTTPSFTITNVQVAYLN